jgi:hypothetical protein
MKKKKREVSRMVVFQLSKSQLKAKRQKYAASAKKHSNEDPLFYLRRDHL